MLRTAIGHVWQKALGEACCPARLARHKNTFDSSLRGSPELRKLIEKLRSAIDSRALSPLGSANALWAITTLQQYGDPKLAKQRFLDCSPSTGASCVSLCE